MRTAHRMTGVRAQSPAPVFFWVEVFGAERWVFMRNSRSGGTGVTDARELLMRCIPPLTGGQTFFCLAKRKSPKKTRPQVGARYAGPFRDSAIRGAG